MSLFFYHLYRKLLRDASEQFQSVMN